MLEQPKNVIDSGRPAVADAPASPLPGEAASRLGRSLEYADLLKEARRVPKDPAANAIKVALLGDCATQQFRPLLRALFHRASRGLQLFEGVFDGLELDCLNPGSDLYGFAPEIVILLNCTQSLRDKYYERQGTAEEFLDLTVSRMTRVWDAIRQHSSAQVIQCNFAAPVERFFGNYDGLVPGSLSSVVSALNAAIVQEARKRGAVLVHDVAALASWVGGRNWYDERFWTLAKSFCATDYLPLAAQGIVDIVLTAKGRTTKCVVLDLDNTLWGGIVGDDGPRGVKIGAHGDGEPFYRLQCFLKELKNRGILLAVCSKNERANALAPFEQNPDMVLKLDDITAFEANWDNKGENIRKIRQQLNIGLDSMVFLDDNPFERNLVRSLVPEILVPELPEDPSDYVRAVCELNLFETSAFSAEDGQRVQFYRQDAERRLAESAAATFEEYLESLQMEIEISRFTPHQLARISQLFQRSNQFNLTTIRHTQADCEQMMNDLESCIPVTAILRDKFGDHGLISIVVARVRPEAGALDITDWVMSCRVLTRGVEEYLMNRVFHEARCRALTEVTATYVPTAKNGMVKEFFAKFGFVRTAAAEDGMTHWTLGVDAYQVRPTFIRETQAS